MSRRTAEHYPSIDIKVIKQILKPGSNVKVLFNFDNQQIEGAVLYDYMKMCIASWKIYLTQTPCNYGGHRYWFKCPSCDARCTRLFFMGKNIGWQCRKCGDLVYRSQQETKTDFWTWYKKAEKIAKKLDINYEADGFDYLFTHPRNLFPDKPSNMHQATYEKLYSKFYAYALEGIKLDSLAAKKIVGVNPYSEFYKNDLE